MYVCISGVSLSHPQEFLAEFFSVTSTRDELTRALDELEDAHVSKVAVRNRVAKSK
jgi:hypothetical protein